MSFVTDLIDHATGASAMNEATDMQRDQFNYWKGLNDKDRADLEGMFHDADQHGFFDWKKRLMMYDKAVDPSNERDLRNVGAALRAAGARPGDTNTDAATAMVLNSQKKQRGEVALKAYEDAFNDRFTMRRAIAGDTNALMQHASETLSNTLMGQGQQQAQQAGMFTQLIAPYLFGGGRTKGPLGTKTGKTVGGYDAGQIGYGDSWGGLQAAKPGKEGGVFSQTARSLVS